jgi:hypothetical protein
VTARVNIERLAIRLRCISREVADAALDGLGEELGRRLARMPLTTLPTAEVIRIDLGREDLAEPDDIAALRAAIASRLVTGLTEKRALAAPAQAAEQPAEAAP